MSVIKGILHWGLVAAGLPGFVFAEDFEGTIQSQIVACFDNP